MAIYHLEAKVISRGTGRSVVAAAAYMSYIPPTELVGKSSISIKLVRRKFI